MKVFLETERLILREFIKEDADLLIDLDSDPDVMKFLTDGKPTPPEEVRNRMIPDLLRFYDSYENLGFWAVIEKETSHFLGWFLLRPAKDPSQGIELGYRFKKTAWGKGYATEGSRALLKRAFSIPWVKRVMAITMKGNTKSWHVMEKLGMKFDKNYVEDKFPGADKAAVQYVITKEDFKSGKTDILSELKRMEPIFHRPEFGTSRAEYENIVVDDFWEVGASGRTYDKKHVLDVLEERAKDSKPDQWETSEFRCQELAQDVYLLTYILFQGERKTRRSTIWKNKDGRWQAAYHQGTIVES